MKGGKERRREGGGKKTKGNNSKEKGSFKQRLYLHESIIHRRTAPRQPCPPATSMTRSKPRNPK